MICGFGIISQVIPAFSRKPLFAIPRWCTRPLDRDPLVHRLGTTCLPSACPPQGSCSSCRNRADRGATGVKVFNWLTTCGAAR